MTFLVGLLLGCPGSALAAAYREQGGLILPCSFMLNALLLYIAGVCHLLEYGVWVISALNLLCLAAALRRIRKNPAAFKANFLTPAMAAFFIWSILLYLANYGRMFYDWDEFSHWGLAAKALFVKGDLYCRFHELMNFPSYPPGMALLQYFYVKIPGVFAEDAVLFASSQFAVSLMAAGLSHVRRQNWKIYVPYILLAWLIPLCFFEFFYSVYVDGILAMLLCFALYLVLSAKRFDLRRIALLSVTLCFMTLVKPSGTGLALMVLAATAAANIRRPLKCLLPLSAILAGTLSWKILLQINQCPVRFSGKSITPEAVFKAFFLNQPEHAHAVIGAWGIKLLPILSLLVSLGIAAMLLSKQCRKKTAMRKAMQGAAVTIPLFGAFFAFTLLIYYIFTFPVYEALLLASFERYMSTVTLCGVMLLLFLAVHALTLFRSHRAYFKITAAILLILPFFMWRTVLNRWQHITSRSYCYLRGAQELMLQELNAARQPGEKVAILTQGSPGTEAFILRYNAFGCAEALPWSIGAPKYKGDEWSEALTFEEYSKRLANTAWLYIHHADDDFRRDYGGLFARRDQIYDGRLYKRHDNGQYHLHDPEKLELNLDRFFFLATEDEETEIANAAVLKTAQFRYVTLHYSAAGPLTVKVGNHSRLIPAGRKTTATLPWSSGPIAFRGKEKAQLKLHKLCLTR